MQLDGGSFIPLELEQLGTERRLQGSVLTYIPNPMGGDVFAYGDYRVRVRGLEPAWDERAPRDGSTCKVLLSVFRQ